MLEYYLFMFFCRSSKKIQKTAFLTFAIASSGHLTKWQVKQLSVLKKWEQLLNDCILANKRSWLTTIQLISKKALSSLYQKSLVGSRRYLCKRFKRFFQAFLDYWRCY